MFSMRIIAGKARRTQLKVPSEHTRPTTDRVREALFSRLQGILPEARVLDLFAGSGALGLEALSRGAQSCDFVELRVSSVTCIQQNLAKSNLDGGRVVRSEVFAFLSNVSRPYDLIFADPPWMEDENSPDFATQLLENDELHAQVLARQGTFILEQPEYWVPDESCLQDRWKVKDLRFYGKTALWTLGIW